MRSGSLMLLNLIMNYPDWLNSFYYADWNDGWWYQFLLWTEFTNIGRWMTIPIGLMVHLGLVFLMVKIDDSDN